MKNPFEEASQPNELSKQHNEQEVFLEIGHGAAPSEYVDGKPSKTFLGVEKSFKEVAFAKKYAEWEDEGSGNNKPKRFFVNADAQEIPYKDECVDIVYISNVFGDSENTHISYSKVLNEASRVLKKDGELVILESNTPEDFVYLTAILKESGFEIEKVTHLRDDDWEKETKKYSEFTVTMRPGGYLLVARLEKKKENHTSNEDAAT